MHFGFVETSNRISDMDQKLIIDTDPGIDDAMAILFALSAPEIHLVGLTTIFGNVTTEIATRNALALAELAGASLPVSRGADRPLAIEPPPIADFVHGPEGFGDVPVIHPRARRRRFRRRITSLKPAKPNPAPSPSAPSGR